MPSFRRLALASMFTTILLVAIGGLVRATGSGLGCGDDWPDCNGRLIPVLNARPVIIEWSHRAVAMIVGILVALLVVRAFQEHRNHRVIVRASLVAFALVIFQALLGRVVVKEELEVLLVVAHLSTAMLFLGALIVTLVLDARATGANPNTTGARGALFAAIAVLYLLMVGSYTSDFGYMPGWPLQQGQLIPDLADQHESVHFFHRTMAAVVAAIVAYVWVKVIRRRELFDATAVRLAHASAGLFALEILIGAANVWTTLHPLIVTLHLATGALVWACMVGLWAVTSPALARSVSAARAPTAAGVVGARG